MLQRAASNAYSWWWASHIRTKQGKWLQQNLDDMEEKVKNILILIEEDADSFARRAEMYYKKRPELISFVEESYRAYRALAERYEHISGELQNANNTIATVFPEQVPISIEEDDDVDNQEKVSTVDPSKVPKTPENPKFKFPIIDAKKRRSSKPKKPQPKKPSSNMTKDEAQEEIDKLQKGILVLQTEKEFVMSSYESGLAKFWDIEQQIEEMQEKVCELQDEFSVSKDIEDNEARALMTASALKSCEDTLVQLQEQQKRSTAEARVEAERVKDAEEKLKAFKDGFLQNHTDDRKLPEEANIADSVNKNLVEEVCNLKEERLELQLICEKLREYFDINSDSSLTVTELAEKVDELVNKVLSLENAVSSQTALIKRLRLETDELQNHLQSLEEDRESLLDDSKSLNDKIRELEEELNRIQDLNRSVKDESSKLQMHFTEACLNLDNLSEELQSPNQQDKVEITGLPQLEESDLHDVGPCKQIEKEEDIKMRVNGLINLKDEIIEQGEIQGTRENHVRSENLLDLKHLHDVGPFKQIEEEEDIKMRVDGPINLKDEIIEQGETQGTQENHVRSENLLDLKQQDEVENKDASQEEDDVLNFGGDSPNWGQLFLNGLEDREKILLAEYTSILRNYKEIKRRLSEVENKSQESLFETTAQIRELKNDNAIKDAEIRSLQQRVSMLQTSLHEKKETRVLKSKDLMQNRAGSTIDQWKSLFSDLHVKSPGQSKLRRLEDLLKEQSINSPSRTDESNAFTSKEHPHSEEEIKESLLNKQHTASTIEGKFRRDIDGLLEENLDFWSRFSTSFDQIQKFQKAVQDLQAKFTKLKNDDKKHESSANAADQTLKSEATSIEKHLRELQTELSAWLEQSASLKDELQCRLSSICKIQEEISRVSKMHSKTEKSEFTEQQAARFQGEVLDMQQENNKVASELQAGLDHVRRLQFEIQKNLSNLHENFELSGSKSNRQQANARNAFSRAKIPLRYFIFGTKPKPKKPSLFSCINPALQKQYSDLRAAGAEPPM